MARAKKSSEVEPNPIGYDDGFLEGMKASMNIVKAPKKSECVVLTFKEGTRPDSMEHWAKLVERSFGDANVIAIPENIGTIHVERIKDTIKFLEGVLDELKSKN